MPTDYVGVINADPGAWTNGHTYAANALVRPVTPNGLMYKTGAGGVSAGLEPTWPLVLGATVVDNTVTWTCFDDLNDLAIGGTPVTTVPIDGDTGVPQAIIAALGTLTDWVTAAVNLLRQANTWLGTQTFASGAIGQGNAASSVGLEGEAIGAGAIGVYGVVTTGGASAAAVQGVGATGTGVSGTATGTNPAVSGTNNNSGGYGVKGNNANGVAIYGLGGTVGVSGQGAIGIEGNIPATGTSASALAGTTANNPTDTTAVAAVLEGFAGAALTATNSSSSVATAAFTQSGSGQGAVVESAAGSAIVAANSGSSATVAGANTGSGAAISGNTATGSGPAVVAIGNTSRASLNIGVYVSLPAAMNAVAGDMAFTTDGHAHVCFTSGTWTTIF